MLPFSNEFLIGTATAAHQVEGNNINSDCWTLENIKHTLYADRSGDAVDHYHRYEEDIKIMASAGMNAYRFSLEWARIEPEEGHFSNAEIEHYRRVIRCCKDNGLEPMIVLMHFSSPKWLISKGGWENKDVVQYFARYCRYVMERLRGEVRFVCTINELNIRLQIADIMKRYAIQRNNADSSTNDAADQAERSVQMGMNVRSLIELQQLSDAEGAKAFGLENPCDMHVFQSPASTNGDEILCRAHVAARSAIREVCPEVQIGLSLSLHDFQPLPGAEEVAMKEWEKEFTHYLPYIEDDDYLGVQNYTRSIIGTDGLQPIPDQSKKTQAGYEFYPKALEHVLRKVAQIYDGPIYVTENGVATDDDADRVIFIQEALNGILNCIRDGIAVKGYFYWSLMDNFEWQKGYAMKFGLVAIDRKDQSRHPKPSLYYLGRQGSKKSL